MRFILRKFVDAESAADALAMDSKTAVHDVYLKEGEEPKRDNTPKDCVGFLQAGDDYWRKDEVIGKKK